MPILSEILKHTSGQRFEGEASKDELDAAADLRSVARIAERYRVDLGSAVVAAHRVVHPARLEQVQDSYSVPRALRLGVEWYLKDGRDYELPVDVLARDAKYTRYRISERDPLGCASKAPLSTLAALRKIATDFCLSIMPVAALDKQVLDSLPADYRRAVNYMRAGGGLYFDVYALAPLSLYSLEQHVKSAAPLSLFSPATEQVGMSLLLNIPMFRSVIGDISSLDERMSGMERQVEAIRKRVAEAERQMASMKTLIERAEQKAAQATIRAARLTKQLESNAFLAQDPLLFAVAKGTEVSVDDAPAILGPCWGADIDIQIVRKLGYKINTTRKAYDKGLPW